MLDKLKFWKKDEDDFDDLPGTPFPDSKPTGNVDPFSASNPKDSFGSPVKDPLSSSPFDNRSNELAHPSAMPNPPAPGSSDPFGQQNDFGIKEPGLSRPSAFEQQQVYNQNQQHHQPQTHTQSSDQQLQMINLKLDAIKTAIENINMRLERIEQQRRY